MSNKLYNAYQIDIYFEDESGECNYSQIEGTFRNTSEDETIKISARLEDRSLNEKPFEVKIIYNKGKYYLTESIFIDTNLIVQSEDNDLIVLEDTNPDTTLEISIHLD